MIVWPYLCSLLPPAQWQGVAWITGLGFSFQAEHWLDAVILATRPTRLLGDLTFVTREYTNLWRWTERERWIPTHTRTTHTHSLYVRVHCVCMCVTVCVCARHGVCVFICVHVTVYGYVTYWQFIIMTWSSDNQMCERRGFDGERIPVISC